MSAALRALAATLMDELDSTHFVDCPHCESLVRLADSEDMCGIRRAMVAMSAELQRLDLQDAQAAAEEASR